MKVLVTGASGFPNWDMQGCVFCHAARGRIW